MARLMALAAIAASAFILSAAPAAAAAADGQLHSIARIVNGDTRLDVDTFSELDANGKELRVSLLSIVGGNKSISLAMDRSDMPLVVQLWRRAARVHSASWLPVGEFQETGTTDPSHLKVSAGERVRFIIESPALGAFTSELSPSDYDAFGAALDQAETYLEGQNP